MCKTAIKLFYIFLIGCTILSVGCEKKTGEEIVAPPPAFELYDTDSVLYSLKTYKGNPLMIHFWADWCPHCREEFPKLQQAYQNLKDRQIEILAVNSGQSRAHVLEIKETYGLTFPVLVDEKAQVAKLYQVTGLPTTLFIDSNGMIFKKYIGWLDEAQILEIFANM